MFLFALRCKISSMEVRQFLAVNYLTYMLDYIVMQMSKVNCEKGYQTVIKHIQYMFTLQCILGFHVT